MVSSCNVTIVPSGLSNVTPVTLEMNHQPKTVLCRPSDVSLCTLSREGRGCRFDPLSQSVVPERFHSRRQSVVLDCAVMQRCDRRGMNRDDGVQVVGSVQAEIVTDLAARAGVMQ